MSEQTTVIQDGSTSYFDKFLNFAERGLGGYLDYETSKNTSQQNQYMTTGQTFPVEQSAGNVSTSYLNTVPKWAVIGGVALLGLVALKVVK